MTNIQILYKIYLTNNENKTIVRKIKGADSVRTAVVTAMNNAMIETTDTSYVPTHIKQELEDTPPMVYAEQNI